jgi:hypothetical protein
LVNQLEQTMHPQSQTRSWITGSYLSRIGVPDLVQDRVYSLNDILSDLAATLARGENLEEAAKQAVIRWYGLD